MPKQLAEVDIISLFPKATYYPTVSSFAGFGAKIIAFGGGLVVSLIIIYAAYSYISAGGDSKKVSQAGSALFWGIVGLIVISIAYWLTQILAGFIGKKF